jgi:molybdenum cofactor cytidylyltransferase
LRLAAVVLAAGRSERMGTNKLLLELGGRAIIDRLLDALDASSVDEIFVVLGHRPEDLRPLVGAHRAEVVLNPGYEEGMTSSFKAGLRRVSTDAAFLILGDQVGLDSGLLDRMAGKMTSDPGALIVSPVYEGLRGHPVLFRRALFKEIMDIGARETLREIVERHEGAHRLVEGDVWSAVDVDTPEEFERVKRLLEAGRDASPRRARPRC